MGINTTYNEIYEMVGDRGIIHNWKVIPHPHNNKGKTCVTGNVYGHGKFGEGEKIRTAPIDSVETDKENGDIIVNTTTGSKYRLGRKHK
jgi:hypothetical protein